MADVVKHCGVLSSTGSRVFVFFRQLEEEPDSCLYVFRDSLPDVYSHAVLGLVMGEGQRSMDLSEVAHARGILDGGNMLTVLHKNGFLRKGKTSEVVMHVGGSQQIRLDHLNEQLANAGAVKQSQVISTVQKDSPFDSFDSTKKATFGSAIVQQLVDQAGNHYKKFEELKNRAVQLDPSASAAFPSTEIETTIIEVPVPSVVSDERVFVIPEGASAAKAVALLKEHMKQFKK